MPIAFEAIEPLLLKAEKPGRYTGGEFNQVVKEGPEIAVRVCLAFPDVYDLGMSYHGYSLLYERINRRERWAAERAFTPWPDFDALLRGAGLPLASLETRRALREFDVVGFTLQHEVNYTNILSMLDLGGVPIESRDRTSPFPLILGGGEGAFSPEPMSPFFDAFVIGDGEEAIEDVCAAVEEAKAGGWGREALLLRLARVPGVYVPEFYGVEYGEDGRVERTYPLREGVPAVVKKRHFDVTADSGSVRPVVPLLRTVHDRLAIEIRRGCVNGCRFCQAGMITRPVRERSVEQICAIAEEGIANTGYDEISLLSLSSADYTAIGTLVRRMTRQFGPRRVSVSLPSLRINAFDVDVADEIRGVRKSGFTFAPEAGTDRLRKVINKEVNQEDFLRIIEEVFRRGWQTVKLYFMVGLPTETDEDLDGIVQLARAAAELGRRHRGRKAIVNITLSPFVPKCNTPFQWEAQPPEAELARRYQYVARRLRGPGIDVKTGDTGSAFIEAALARGDRKVARAIRRAWELGCRFDGWDEYFSKELWLKAFELEGLDPAFYANRQRGEDEVFPFDHIDASLGKRFLWADQRRAWRQRVMEPCEVGKCAGCDACYDAIEHVLAVNQPGAEDGMERYTKEAIRSRAAREERLAEGRRLEDPNAESQVFAAATRYSERAQEMAARAAAGECAPEVFSRYAPKQAQPAPRFAEPPKAQRVRLRYSRLGALRFLAHLDMTKALTIALRRARAPLSYSEGFNPQPRVGFAPPLPVGIGGRAEAMDVVLREAVDPARLVEDLNAATVEGLRFHAAEEIDLKAGSLDALAEASRFAAWLAPAAASAEEIDAALRAFGAAETFPVQLKKKNGMRTVDLRRSILSVESAAEEGGTRIRMTISHEEGLFAPPHRAVALILGRALELGPAFRVEREEILLRPEPAAARERPAPLAAVNP